MHVLTALWEAPQNVLGGLTYAVLSATGRVEETRRERSRLFVRTRGVGISLGWFVFWSDAFAPGFADAGSNKDHEFGHSIQSRWFGPLYLLAVGVPSVGRVLYGQVHYRVTGRPWTGYYDGWPENHADRLGGVVRKRGPLGVMPRDPLSS